VSRFDEELLIGRKNLCIGDTLSFRRFLRLLPPLPGVRSFGWHDSWCTLARCIFWFVLPDPFSDNMHFLWIRYATSTSLVVCVCF